MSLPTTSRPVQIRSTFETKRNHNQPNPITHSQRVHSVFAMTTASVNVLIFMNDIMSDKKRITCMTPSTRVKNETYTRPHSVACNANYTRSTPRITAFRGCDSLCHQPATSPTNISIPTKYVVKSFCESRLAYHTRDNFSLALQFFSQFFHHPGAQQSINRLDVKRQNRHTQDEHKRVAGIMTTRSSQ